MKAYPAITEDDIVAWMQHFQRMGYMMDQGGGLAVRDRDLEFIYATPINIQKNTIWDK